MGKIKETKTISAKPRKQRAPKVSIHDPCDRIVALENTYIANHTEIMRMLSEMNTSMKDGFMVLTERVQAQAVKQATQDEQIKNQAQEIVKIDSKITKIMGGVGAVALTIVGGIFTLAARYFGK